MCHCYNLSGFLTRPDLIPEAVIFQQALPEDMLTFLKQACELIHLYALWPIWSCLHMVRPSGYIKKSITIYSNWCFLMHTNYLAPNKKYIGYDIKDFVIFISQTRTTISKHRTEHFNIAIGNN